MINDSGEYGFVLIAVDEKEKGTKDKFRIKIWDKMTGKSVYDSGLGGPEEVLPTTSIAGGKIDVNKDIKSPK